MAEFLTLVLDWCTPVEAGLVRPIQGHGDGHREGNLAVSEAMSRPCLKANEDSGRVQTMSFCWKPKFESLRSLCRVIIRKTAKFENLR